MSLALFNPSIASRNLGDLIIEDAVLEEIGNLFPDQQVIQLPTQEIVGRRTHRIARDADYRLVGGTNLLSSHMLRYRQWMIGLLDANRIGPTTLMGVGWWQYQDDPDSYTKLVLRTILSKDGLHSVRDEYTRKKLTGLGLTNVVNTCCPTTWCLTPRHCRTIPASKAKEVVFTITDYHPDPDHDGSIFELLLASYDRVFFWPQGSGDMDYASKLGVLSDATVISPSVSAYNQLLRDQSLDFVGTRLHAGIRAMQMGKRAIILGVDNRSAEISRDIGLRVVQRDDREALRHAITTDWETQLTLPTENIEKWRKQFQNSSSESS